MPDTRFTLAGLKEHLRRWLAVYVVVVAVCMVLTSLLWTTTRPRVPTDRAVLVYLTDSYSNPEPLAPLVPKLLEAAQASDPKIEEFSFEGLMYADPNEDYTGSMLLMTRLATGEGDVFLASQAAMDALVRADALLPLEAAVEGGWLARYELEPYYATVTDEESGERRTYLAGLRLDGVDALMDMGAFNNRGAYLALPAYGENTDAAMAAMDAMLEALTEGDNGTDRTE